MYRKIFILFVLILIPSLVVAQEIEWTKKGIIEENSKEFVNEFKLKSISGDWGDVIFDSEKREVSNKGVSVKLSDLEDKKVTALDNGGFLVEGKEINLFGNEYDSSTIMILQDNFIEIPEDTSVNGVFGVINAESELKLKFNEDNVQIIGESKIDMGNNIAFGSDLTYHYTDTNIDELKFLDGNHVYLSSDNFAIKGLAKIEIRNGEIKSSYFGDHGDTFIKSSGKEITVESSNNFPELTTIAHSEHETLLNDFDKNEKFVSTMKIKYMSSAEGNRIFATGVGSLGKVAKLNVDIVKMPGLNINFGDERVSLEDKIYFENIVVNPQKMSEKSKMSAKLLKVSEEELSQGIITKVESNSYLGYLDSQYSVNPDDFNRLRKYYKFDYQGTEEEKVDDFLIAVESLENSKTKMKAGANFWGNVGAMSTGTDVNQEIRKNYLEMARIAGFSSTEMNSLESFLNDYTTSDSIIFDSENSKIIIEGNGKELNLDKEIVRRINSLMLIGVYSDEKTLTKYRNYFKSLLE